MRAHSEGEESFSADCSCGWIGGIHTGPSARLEAQREALEHLEHERQPIGPTARE
jgi:hypothetical protein